MSRGKTRILITSAMLLVLGCSSAFYGIAYLEEAIGTPESVAFLDIIRVVLGVDLSAATHLSEFREALWRTAFALMIRIQLIWVLMIVAFVGPGLIANDLRSRALPIYFSKPITPQTYLLSKWIVVASFIAVVNVVPNLMSLIIGVLLTGGLDGWGPTLRLAWDMLMAGGGVAVVGGSVMLAISSLTSDRRYATVGWLAICLLPRVAQAILHEALSAKVTKGFLGSISLNGDVMILTEWLMDIRRLWEATPLPPEAFGRAMASHVEPFYPAVVLLLVTAVSVLVCYRRVVRFSRSAANV